ncbi:hypothetical protein N790_04100 [Arenimonas malthae CC-JY-1]|uniref:Tll0287-like domain-containing protein n=2 Tax=Arenimonas TaxID=490567 RepID=A0A091BG98_9GAMM|nr:hypothetical protein N790_04100 [Arenimonas malthae CC-JY-1]
MLAACGSEPAPAPVAVEPGPVPETAPEATAPAPGTVVAAPDAQARAQAAMKDFAERLRGRLREAMTRDGAPAAVDFCHLEAPRIAEQVMAEHGVRLGRVAVPGRNRNPGNVAEGWLQELAVSFQAAVDTGGAPEAQVAVLREDVPPGIELRMARGIRVEAACLMCHGDNIAPEIAARLAEHYPGDRATGFKEGDLRGLIWAEVPANPGTTP